MPDDAAHLDEAQQRVLAEPFWGAFRRRHPEVDLVLLPPRDPGSEPGTVPEDRRAAATPEQVAAAADRTEATADALWRTCADAAPDDAQARWTTGPVPGAVRREVTRTASGVDVLAAAAVIDRGAAALREAGWRVTEPAGGVPRVLASRGAGQDREEALLLVTLEGRATLRLRSPGFAVTATAARRLVTGGAA